MGDEGRPLRVLLADDDPSTRLLLRRWVSRSLQADIAEAENGVEALEQIAASPVDLVVLDVNMPLLDGIECLSMLRSDPARKDLEVLIASVVQTESRVREAIALGVSDYVLKPLEYESFSLRLRRAAQRIKTRREERSQEHQSNLPRVLIGDPDPNFCDFAQSALAGRFACQGARSAGDALVQILRWKPDLVLLSPQMPGISLQFLLTKIGSLKGSSSMQVYLLANSAPEGIDSKHVSGLLPRTYVPETFRSRVLQLLQGGGPVGRGILTWIQALDPEVLTALRQALGMMTGIENIDAAEPAEAPSFELFGSIAIEADSKDLHLMVEIDCRRDLARALSAAMIGGDAGDLDEAMQNSSVGEILNVVAGRIKNSCLERKIPVAVQLPALAAAPPERPRELDHQWRRYFSWQDSHFFRLSFSAWTSPAVAVAEPAAS